MNKDAFEDWLERETQKLPRSIAPDRDLWPGISSRLHTAHSARPDLQGSRVWPFLTGMAAALLVAVAVTQLQPQDPGMPATGEAPIYLVERPAPWVPEVTRARNQLNSGFESGLDSLAPPTRRIVEDNLMQIHNSLAQIHEALAADPGNLALHRMLARTYQQELQLISNIGALSDSESQL